MTAASALYLFFDPQLQLGQRSLLDCCQSSGRDHNLRKTCTLVITYQAANGRLRAGRAVISLSWLQDAGLLGQILNALGRRSPLVKQAVASNASGQELYNIAKQLPMLSRPSRSVRSADGRLSTL